MNSPSSALVKFSIPLIVTMMLATGCSSSNDSGDPRSPDAIADETSNGIGEGPSTTIPDSTAQNSTRVDFNITVPAYVSDALQVRLDWSIKDEPETWVSKPAIWVGNEFWTAFGDTTSVEKVASQTIINSSVMWSGTYARSDSSSGVFDEIGFTTETDSIDDQTHKQAGTIDRKFRTGSYQASQNISYNLTGRVIDDSSSCEPITGTITNAQQNAYVAVTTITREAGERYWRVGVVDNDQILDKYLISSLGMTFYCAFGA